MRIAVDTNVLLRASLDDDARQSEMARRILRDATQIVISMQAVCEFAWVLERGYRRGKAEVAAMLRYLVEIDKIVIDRAAVNAGLALLELGGDFADGVIAHDGQRLGGARFATFDRQAAQLLSQEGFEIDLLDPPN